MKIPSVLWFIPCLVLGSCATTSVDRLTADLDQTNVRMVSLETLNRGLSDQVGLKDAELVALRAKWTALSVENAALVASLESLKTGETSTEASSLGQIDALNKAKAVLQDRITALEVQVAALSEAASRASQDLDKRITDLKVVLADQIAAGSVDIKRYRDVLVISVKDSVLFRPDSPQLLDPNEGVLRALAAVFTRLPDRIVRIEGNTAVAVSSPETLKLYPTSWHLGAARAANVVQFLQEQCGMDPHQLVAASLGEYSPQGNNTTEAGRAQNRRVEFVLVARSLWEIDRLNSVLKTP